MSRSQARSFMVSGFEPRHFVSTLIIYLESSKVSRIRQEDNEVESNEGDDNNEFEEER